MRKPWEGGVISSEWSGISIGVWAFDNPVWVESGERE